MNFSRKDLLITGFALLAMFFGAGNLIFPPMLGLQSGENLFWGILGFIITGVGLPFLGVTAVAYAGGDLELLANRVNPTFSKIITTIAILCIGPLLAIPRTAATSFEVAIAPLLNSPDSNTIQITLLVTTIIYFAITLFFVLKPTDLLNNLGKILTPLLLIFLGIIIIKGIINPLGSLAPGTYTNPFAQGFLEGYNTMDAIASVIFGMIIVKGVTAKGISNNAQIAKITMYAGLIAASGLAFIYIGLAYIGATTGSNFTGSNHGEMLSYISQALLGNTGKLVMGLAITLACLTTAIGLVASCGEFFSRLSNYRLSYNTVAIITTLVSFLLANLGLAKILTISAPLLEFVYPIIIVLVILSLFHNFFKGKRIVYQLTIGIITTLVLIDSIYKIGTSLGINLALIGKMLNYLPLYQLGFAWVIPAVLSVIVALFIITES
ncbi:MAG: branched-chain amino acid transport system II carrier protein [Syntrophomonadaceae bacterium]|nr:branched-chain amino acid transport system II carrier protein [Syntrophomonadaceae bacterium]